MLEFVKGRYYRSDKVYLVTAIAVSKGKKFVKLESAGERMVREVSLDAEEEYCVLCHIGKDEIILWSHSVMGRPQKLTEDEVRQHRIKFSREYNKENYKPVTFMLPPDVAEGLKSVSERTKTPQRQLVIQAVKELLDKYK